MVVLLSQVAQLAAGLALVWGAWTLRKVPAYSTLMAAIGALHLFTGAIGLVHLDDVTVVAVWRQPAFILQRGLIGSLVIVIVNRNRRLSQIASR